MSNNILYSSSLRDIRRASLWTAAVALGIWLMGGDEPPPEAEPAPQLVERSAPEAEAPREVPEPRRAEEAPTPPVPTGALRMRDPRLDPKRAGVGVPQDWYERTRGKPHVPRSRVRPVVGPEVPERPAGQPPSPQGAGAQARAVARGPEPEPPPPSEGELEELRSAVASRWDRVAECFAAPPDALEVELALLRADGLASSFPAAARDAAGGELEEPVEDCVLQALDDLDLPPVSGDLLVGRA